MKSQQQFGGTGLNQANRDQIASSINQIGRRPSAQQPGDYSAPPQSTIQRPDSRIGSAQPTAPLSAQQQQQQPPISVQRPVQPQQQQQQPQYQPRQIIQQVIFNSNKRKGTY